jgi:hypothetical protein
MNVLVIMYDYEDRAFTLREEHGMSLKRAC